MGIGFGSFVAVLPLFVSHMTDSALLIGLVPAIHGGMVEGDDAAAFTTVACGLVVTMGGVRIYHCGDTALTMEMQLLEGRVDVMLCPIGDNFTMGVDDAVRAVGFVKPRTVI